MTRKQVKKFANEIYQCELIHESGESSKEDKARAEERIMQLTNQIMALKNGIEIMLEVDEYIQSTLANKN